MISTRSPRLAALAVLAVAALATVAVLAQSQDIAATIALEGEQGSSTMKLIAGGENLRMDMGAARGEVSMVWAGGSMLMINHPQRTYMEFTQEMMEGMRAMAGRMGQQAPEADVEPPDVSGYSFGRTGATDTINGMSAFEVAVTSPDGEQGSIWMTTETDTGLFEVFAAMAGAMNKMQMPGMMGGGGNPTDALQEYTFLARAQGLPEGRVIRLATAEAGGQVVTLMGVEHGPFGPETWVAPAGYTKQQMPMMRQ